MALAATVAPGTDAIPGPINARVVSVYDGDTMTVNAGPWPSITVRTSVRMDGKAIPVGVQWGIDYELDPETGEISNPVFRK